MTLPDNERLVQDKAHHLWLGRILPLNTGPEGTPPMTTTTQSMKLSHGTLWALAAYINWIENALVGEIPTVWYRAIHPDLCENSHLFLVAAQTRLGSSRLSRETGTGATEGASIAPRAPRALGDVSFINVLHQFFSSMQQRTSSLGKLMVAATHTPCQGGCFVIERATALKAQKREEACTCACLQKID